ncbi:protein Lilipod isoform X3 [Zootermopsis nevadensis]|uniref:protein Lilipod isoform X3 n=1 Tax=Zootermopsis nevadensis TaxID=136037 RepID=UPI000B8E4B62|nr:protein Lilipod isoform X3 [Zootermopsis nevadensis]
MKKWIFLLLLLLLYMSSYAIIRRFRRQDREDYFSTDEDEITVYRISLWLCTFSLAVSVGAALLLPISILSNEILLYYPDSYYVKWLNSSLIQGLWNHVFLFSNLSLFILLPFAYLFTESEGFTGYRKGLMARVYETFIVLCLLAVVMLGMTYVMSALIDKEQSNIHTLLNLWTYYLPFLYSCISFLGVLMLLLCTPLGFVRLFGVVGQFLVKPQFLRDVDEEFFVAQLEEDCLSRRLNLATATGKSYVSPAPMCLVPVSPGCEDDIMENNPDILMTLQNGALQSGLGERLNKVQFRRKVLDKQRHTSSLQRNLMYPVAMLLLCALTAVTVLMVLQNTLELLIGIKALPLSTRQFSLGISSLSKLGPIGAALEILLIFYLIATSSVGLYTLPFLSQMRPRTKMTSLTHIIANCGLALILSSALPLLSRILGITNFDLLGDFGRIEWLGNFKIVLLYNLVFAATATLCLVNKFTATVRRELYARLKSFLLTLFHKPQRHRSTSWMSSSPNPTSGKED